MFPEIGSNDGTLRSLPWLAKSFLLRRLLEYVSRGFHRASLLTASVLICVFCLTPPIQSQETFADVLGLAEKDPKQAIKIAKKLTAQATAESDLETGRILEFLARYRASIGEIAQANKDVLLAKKIAERLENRDLRRRTGQLESAIACEMADFNRGVEAANVALKMTKPTNVYRAIVLNERATNYLGLQKYGLAIDDLLEARDIARHDKPRLAQMVQINLGRVYIDFDHAAKAIEILQDSLEIAEQEEDKKALVAVRSYLASAYQKIADQEKDDREKFQANIELAKENYQLALGMASTLGMHAFVGDCHKGLGEIQAVRLDFEDARDHFSKAQVAYLKVYDHLNVAAVQTRLDSLDVVVVDPERQIELLEDRLEQQLANSQLSDATDTIDLLVSRLQVRNKTDRIVELLNKKNEIQKNQWSEAMSKAIKDAEQSIKDAEQSIEAQRQKQQLQKDLESSRIQEFELINQQRLQIMKLKNQQLSITIAVVIGGVALAACCLFFWLWRSKSQLTDALETANAHIRQEQQRTVLVERQLGEQQKVESLSMMSAGVMHDFNNYLCAIIANAETGLRFAPDSIRQTQQLKSVLESASYASELTKSISNYIGNQKLSLEVVDLNDFLKSSDSFLRMLGGELEIHCHDDEVPVAIDMNAMRSVLVNIVKNSKEAVDNRCRAEGDSFKPLPIRVRSEIVSHDDQEFAVLAISDNGLGISNENLNRAFDPYFSTKGLGRGLGLASSLGIVRSHNGEIDIQSNGTGEGTTVQITLPITRINEARSHPSDSDEASSSENDLQHSILYVDDDEMVRNAIKNLLAASFQCEVVEDAEQALSLISSGATFDCIITDFALPGINGIELSKQIREAHPELPVILVSGFVDDELVKNGSLNFLPKPFSFSELLTKVRELLANRELA